MWFGVRGGWCCLVDDQSTRVNFDSLEYSMISFVDILR